MSHLLEPRTTPPNAWKRWLRVGAKLGWRVWLTILPLSLIVGLAGGWMSTQLLGFGVLLLTTVSGLWQAMLLHTTEQAARGKRVDVGTAWDGLMALWRLPGGQAIQQIRARAIVSVLVFSLLMLLFFLPLYWFASQNPEAAKAPEKAVTGVMLFFQYAGVWGTVFLWSWLLQRGGSVAMANMLVRQHGMDWESAHALSEKAQSRNRHNLQPLSMIFIAMAMVLFFAPWMVFLLEVVWASVISVAARDIFENKEALEPQEARVSTTSLATAR